MAGGTKPGPGTRKAGKFQDGVHKSGGIGRKKHAGPKRASKTAAKSGNARLREQAKRVEAPDTTQQGNRANVRQNTTRQGNRRSA
ncbi:MAG: hypothetical protein ACRECO_06755 [Xanthobacteraceae bacterium]